MNKQKKERRKQAHEIGEFDNAHSVGVGGVGEMGYLRQYMRVWFYHSFWSGHKTTHTHTCTLANEPAQTGILVGQFSDV